MIRSIWVRALAVTGAVSAGSVGLAYGQTVARFTLDEGHGTTAGDTSGNANNATISGAVWTPGRCGTALAFDGVDDYAITNTSLTFARNAPSTITAWVRVASYPAANQDIVAQAETAFSFSPRFWLSASGHIEAYYSAPGVAAAQASDPDLFPLNAWTHVAVTWNYPVLRLYINGALKAQADGSAIPDTTTVNPLLIGATMFNAGGLHNFFSGAIDDVVVRADVAPAEEIQLLSRTGCDGAPGPAGPSGSQLWNMFLLSAATPSFASTFTPDGPIVVTRIEARFATAPVGCTRQAVFLVTDGTAAGTITLPLTAAGSDSGPLSVPFSAGTKVHAGIAVPSICTQSPALGNVSVQYKAR
jgi:hypothetical protein